jgi:hypothetical protein
LTTLAVDPGWRGDIMVARHLDRPFERGNEPCLLAEWNYGNAVIAFGR